MLAIQKSLRTRILVPIPIFIATLFQNLRSPSSLLLLRHFTLYITHPSPSLNLLTTVRPANLSTQRIKDRPVISILAKLVVGRACIRPILTLLRPNLTYHLSLNHHILNLIRISTLPLTLPIPSPPIPPPFHTPKPPTILLCYPQHMSHTRKINMLSSTE